MSITPDISPVEFTPPKGTAYPPHENIPATYDTIGIGDIIHDHLCAIQYLIIGFHEEGALVLAFDKHGKRVFPTARSLSLVMPEDINGCHFAPVLWECHVPEGNRGYSNRCRVDMGALLYGQTCECGCDRTYGQP